MVTRETKEAKGVTINVMGREFRVASPDGEERELHAAVDLLNRKMKDIRDGGKVVGNERIAILAALNIAHDLVSNARPGRTATNVVDEGMLRRRIEAFEGILEKAVTEQEKLF